MLGAYRSDMASLTKRVLNLNKLFKHVNNCTKRLSSHFTYFPDNEKPVEGK